MLEINNTETPKYEITIIQKNNIKKIIITDKYEPDNVISFTISNKLRKINFVYYENKIKY